MGKFLAETKPTAAQKSRNARQSPTVRRALANRLVLRRKDGPSYGDRALAAYVGKRVICDGFITGYL